MRRSQKDEAIMERMLTVVFGNESNAYEGSRILTGLDSERNVYLAETVITKNLT